MLIVAPDLFEEVENLTCFPVRLHRQDMRVGAKLDCGRDPTCAAVVEAPKRRGQNRKIMYGPYIYTEREYLICEYPLSTKATNDTLMYKKRGKLIQL